MMKNNFKIVFNSHALNHIVSKGGINISTVTLCRRLYKPIKDKMNRQKQSKTKLYVGQQDGTEGESSCHASG